MIVFFKIFISEKTFLLSQHAPMQALFHRAAGRPSPDDTVN